MTDSSKNGGGRGGRSGSGARRYGGAGTPKAPRGELPASSRGQVTVHVKTAHKRSNSSTRWLQRQLNDPYVAEAKRQGWRSRAAFKLLQLDDKFHFLKQGQKIVDLGAAPGGWTQVAVKTARPELGRGCVVGLDILEMEDVAGATTFVADFTEDSSVERLKELLDGEADVVMSDMAAVTIGHQKTDHLRIMALAELAADFACEVLREGGFFVCKLFQGGADKDLMDVLRTNFRVVKHAKPAASRSESSEMYVVALGFKGRK